MSDEQEVTVTEQRRQGEDANTPTLSVLLGAIESFHTRPRAQRPVAAPSDDARAPANISKQLEALDGNEDFTFA
jgi:hypothetical protein